VYSRYTNHAYTSRAALAINPLLKERTDPEFEAIRRLRRDAWEQPLLQFVMYACIGLLVVMFTFGHSVDIGYGILTY
jgi:hypothetical protein